MKKIYLACPYIHADHNVMKHRFNLVNKAAAALMAKGFLVFSPISHTHPIALEGDLPLEWDFWEAYDRTFIEWCDELYVLVIGGWRVSTGVTAEIKIAKGLKKPVFYMRSDYEIVQKL